MIPPAVGLFFKGLPWGKIILFIGIALVAWAVVSYIKTAEENRAKVVKLKTDVSDLKKANADLEAEYKGQLRVLQDSIEKERKRENYYAENIETLRAGPNGSCAVNSPAIANSLRMRRERSTSDAARKNQRPRDNARDGSAAQRPGP